MQINIAGSRPVEDKNYRYKMPPIVPKIEGRGNGIKTVLQNISEVALALNREPHEVTKFFGFELGSQTTFSEDGVGKAVVSGAHTSQDLQTLLSKYIEMFVLCKKCRLPETHYKSKAGVINQKCHSCGEKSACDEKHKLTAFIVKHHKKDKKDKMEKNDADAEAAVAPLKNGKDKKESADSNEPISSPTKEKKRKEKKEIDDPANEDEENLNFIIGTAIDQFKRWYTDHPLAAHDNLVSYERLVVEELRLIQTQLSLKPMDRIMIFMGSAFSAESPMDQNQVAQHLDVLRELAPSDDTIKQRHLIAATEWFCGSCQPVLLPYFSVFLRQLYFSELIDEEVAYEWNVSNLRNEFTVDKSLIASETLEFLKQAAKPFIDWLQAADDCDGDGGVAVQNDENESDDEEPASNSEEVK